MSQVVSEGRIVRILKRLKIFDQWEVAKWAYQQGWEIDKSNFIFWTVMNILGALIPVYLLRVTQEVVNSITIGVETSDFKKVTWRVALLCALWILQSSYNIIPNIIKYTMQTRYSIAMQRKYAAFVNTIPLYKFDNKEFSDQISQVGVTCNRLAYFIGGTTSMIGSFVGTIGLLWFAFSTSWILLVIGSIQAVVSLVLVGRVFQQYYDFWSVAKMERRKQQYYSGLLTGREIGKEIRAMKLSEFFRSRWRVLVEKLTGMEIELEIKSNRVRNILALMYLLFTLLILGVGVWLVWRGKILLGGLVIIWQLNDQLFGTVQSLVSHYLYTVGYMPVLANQKEVFELVFDETGLPTREHKEIKPKEPVTVFRLENVTFGYVPEKTVLRNISFSVNRGETVALVGDNGAGKTTLIKLLLGLYTPNKGRIYFEGLPYQELTQEYLYGKMGVVFQDFKQYHFTIRENIAFGDIKQLHNDAVLMEAARKGQADKLIQAQPKGLDTFLGRQYEEDGLELSGGEWQRIGVARAHVSDKDILILDEPAAKLDPVAEMEQFLEIKNSLGGRTAVLVSHRLGFARLADKIIVLKDGELVDMGTHEELIKAGRHYAEMFRAQAEWYEGSVAFNGFERANEW